MGYLHEGHLSLVDRARRENDLVVASIFVNPLQFGPGEDLAKYPRNLRRDRALLRGARTDLLFEPRPDFYPAGFATSVQVPRLAEPFCGPFRPGHFAGVATVVSKLLLAAEPDRLYLGQKDYQQAVLLARLVRDLNFGCRVVICPTVRESDGLAMSSRNVYLGEAERAYAPALYRGLRDVAARIRNGSIRSAGGARKAMERHLAGGPIRLQYADVRSADDLSPVQPLRGRLVLAVAAFLGRTRLIDNILVRA